LGRGKRTQINRWVSGAESCTGIGVVVGFSGPVDMLNSPHMQMDESSSKKDIFIFYRLLGQLAKLATSSVAVISTA
jgi:hypothetical protein